MTHNEICRLLLNRKWVTVPEIQKEFSLSYSAARNVIANLVRNGDFAYGGGVTYCRTQKEEALKRTPVTNGKEEAIEPPRERPSSYIEALRSRSRRREELLKRIAEEREKNDKDPEAADKPSDAIRSAEENEEDGTDAEDLIAASGEVVDGLDNFDEVIEGLREIAQGLKNLQQDEEDGEESEEDEADEADGEDGENRAQEAEEPFGSRRFEPQLIVAARQLQWQRSENPQEFYLFINKLKFGDGTDFNLKVLFRENGRMYLSDGGYVWKTLLLRQDYGDAMEKILLAPKLWSAVRLQGKDCAVETSVPHLLADAVRFYLVIEYVLR